MKPYKDYRPTQFDTKGLALEDKQSWLVAPVGLNRDSDALDRANWDAFLADLDDAAEYEIHRFGHWACGWFEIIIVKPGSKAAELAQQAEDRLSQYPVLDEDLFGQYEYEENTHD